MIPGNYGRILPGIPGHSWLWMVRPCVPSVPDCLHVQGTPRPNGQAVPYHADARLANGRYTMAIDQRTGWHRYIRVLASAFLNPHGVAGPASIPLPYSNIETCVHLSSLGLSTDQQCRLTEELAPFVTGRRLGLGRGVARVFTTICEMHKRPSHREHRHPVPLCRIEQLVKSCL